METHEQIRLAFETGQEHYKVYGKVWITDWNQETDLLKMEAYYLGFETEEKLARLINKGICNDE
jgi:hypothetical protein